MRILVTGSGGFVGQHLCRHLTSNGDEVVLCPGPEGPGALDVTDSAAVRTRISDAQPDGIIHLAGISSVAWSHSNALRTFNVNTIGAVNLLQAAREAVPKARLLVVGSGEMYGRVEDGHRAREGDALSPLSPYAASKCAAEDAARQYYASYGLEVVCARPFNHLGAGQSANFVVPSFARQIAAAKKGKRPAAISVGDLNPVRDFLHVEDVVRGYRLLLEKGCAGTPYNLSSGEPLSIRALLGQLLELADLDLEVHVDAAKLRPTEIPWLVGDPSRIGALGWHPKHEVREALRDALQEALKR